MPKAKKSESEKITKIKSPKPLKAEKPAKEKKVKKKDKDAAAASAEVKTLPKPVKVVKKPAAAKPVKAAPPEIPAPTTDEISLRAYFIAERRQAMGWPGDSAHDWIEAERQLKAEAKRKAAKK